MNKGFTIGLSKKKDISLDFKSTSTANLGAPPRQVLKLKRPEVTQKEAKVENLSFFRLSSALGDQGATRDTINEQFS